MPIEVIEWLDSGTHLSDGWMQLEVVKQQAKASLQYVTTAGHVVHEDDEVVIVGLSVGGDAVFGAQVIAKSNIRYRAQVTGLSQNRAAA